MNSANRYPGCRARSLSVALLPMLLASGAGEAASIAQQAEIDGIGVNFSMRHSRPGQEAEPFRDGDDVTVRFRISGSDTGEPLSGAYPAAWLDRVGDGESRALDATRCQARIARLLGGDLFSRAELDLNSYRVLTLNDEASISVVDPLFGYGGSKLLARIPLPAPGVDWVLSPDRDRLYVASPGSGDESGTLSIIDTRTWEVERQLPLPPSVHELLLQADGNRLWAAHDAGLSALDTRTGDVAHAVPLSPGIHQMAGERDSRWLFVTDPAVDRLVVVDLDGLRVARRIATGGRPRTPAYSAFAGVLYVADDEGLLVIDAVTATEVGRVAMRPTLGEVAFTPDGRYAFAVDPRAGEVSVIDAAHHRVIKQGPVPGRPMAVEFSDELAYLLTAEDTNVWMVSIRGLADDGTPLSIVDIPAGRYPLSAGSGLSPAAEAVVQAPGHNAVLLANPADRAIYYYKEGMAAAMGSFQNYGRQPRAVQVVDRSLREVEAGVYQTTVKLTAAGSYNVPLFMDAPRTLHCFHVRVELAQRDVGGAPAVHLRPALTRIEAHAGQPVAVRFMAGDRRPATGLADVTALITYRSGLSQRRVLLNEESPGHYLLSFTPPEPGDYRISLASVTGGFGYHESQPVTVRALARSGP